MNWGKKNPVCYILLIPLFLFMALCIHISRAEATEPISIKFTFGKSSYVVGEEITVNYKITGGSGAFDSTSYSCYAYEKNTLVLIKSGIVSTSSGTITYTPRIGQKTQVEMYGYDSENRFFDCSSNEILLSNGISSEPISIKFTFDKSSYAVGEEITVNYKITGGSGVFDSTSYSCYAYEKNTLVLIKSGIVSTSSGTITYTPRIGQKTQVEMYGYDSENRFFDCSSNEILLSDGISSEPILIKYSFDKASYVLGEEIQVNYKITGGSGVFNSTSYSCWAYDNNTLVLITSGRVSKPTGTITFTPSIGQKTYVEMYGYDSENRFFEIKSKMIPLTCRMENHHIVIDAAVYPSNTRTGLTEGKHCSICNEVIIPQSVIPALNNMLVLYLPSSLKRIENETFLNNSCQAVIIPDGCESIGENAFGNCSNLIYVVIPSSVKNYPENAFENCKENIVINWKH